METLEDLNNRLTSLQFSLDTISEDDIHRVAYLGNYGGDLVARFHLTGSVEDLEEAIQVLEIAVKLPTENNQYRACSLLNYGNALRCRFEHQRLHQGDLTMAVDALDQAVELIGEGQLEQPMYLNALACALITQFDLDEDIDNLNKAISITARAVQLGSKHPGQAMFFSNLGSGLQERFKRLGSMSDLDEAIEAKRQAIGLTPANHPNRGDYLNNLGMG